MADSSVMHRHDVICIAASGPVIVCRGAARDILSPGQPLKTGEKVTTAKAGLATLEFIDGSRCFVGAQSEIEVSHVAVDQTDTSIELAVTVIKGGVIFQPSAAGTHADDYRFDLPTVSVCVRMARALLNAEEGGADTVTLLPPWAARPLGEILVFGTLGSRLLEREWQTVRCTGRDADISAPLVVPRALLDPLVAKLRLGPYFLDKAWHLYAGQKESPLPAFDTGAKTFAPFQALGDQLFERRFVPDTVYPHDFGDERTKENELFEDAFDGRRFRLPQ